MKKILLVATLMGIGMVSNAFAASQYDWSGVIKGPHGKDSGIAAIHEYDAKQGKHGICLVSAAVADTSVSLNMKCDQSAIDLPAGAIFSGFQVKSRDGLHLKYNMVKSEFIDALNHADIRYVG